MCTRSCLVASERIRVLYCGEVRVVVVRVCGAGDMRGYYCVGVIDNGVHLCVRESILLFQLELK